MTSNPKLESSKRYDTFVSHPDQQPMSPRRVQELMGSLRDVGYLPSKPIQVCWDPSLKKFVIIDGHHRVAAAKSLGIPFYYVVEPIQNRDLIGRVNLLVGKWKNTSFAAMYAHRGNKDYAELLEYSNKGIPLQFAASLLRGETASSGNAGQLVRDGSFTIKTRESMSAVLAVFDSVGDSAPVVRDRSYIDALSMLLFVPEFCLETFIQRAGAQTRAFVKCANREQALELMEEIYNFRAREKLELVKFAKRLAKQRSAVPKP